MPAKSTDRSSRASDPATRFPIDLRRYPGIRRLAVDYSCNFPAVAPFFAGDPSDHAAWMSAIARTLDQPRSRAELASIVQMQQRRREAPPEAIEAGRQLQDAGTVAIVTGQQAGLFGGPLFTLLKALTALKLADRVSRDHGVAALAVFWIEAEDHDWDEVRSCTVLDESLLPRTVALSNDSVQSGPVASVALGDAIVTVLDELEAALPATEFRGQLLAGLRRAYSPGRGMVEAFGRWLEHLLGHLGLVVYDSSDAASKSLAARVFTRELTMPGEASRLAAEAGADLEARGYHWQVRPAEDSVALFHLDGGREAIRHRDGAFFIGERRCAREELVEEATARPASFSPNVLLRPIVQDSLFPTACYVAGPNELGYLAQLRGVYERFGVPMPIVYPRAMGTILDRAAVRFLTKHELPFETLQRQDEAALNELLEKQIPRSVEEAFAATGSALETEMTRLIEAMPAVDPTLEGAAASTLKRMRHDLDALHGKVIQAAKRRDETLRRQFLRVRALAFPNGHPQEREIGFAYFWNQYGPALVERLDHELTLELGQHWVVAI